MLFCIYSGCSIIIGIVNWIEIIKKKIPRVIMGYFNPTITTMKASRISLSKIKKC